MCCYIRELDGQARLYLSHDTPYTHMRGHTHSCRQWPVKFSLCIYPIQALSFLRGAGQEQWAAFLYSARGPTSVVVDTGQMPIFCMFLVGVHTDVVWRNPRGSTGRTCKLHTERPFRRDSPPGQWALRTWGGTHHQRPQRPMRESNSSS